jgi:hypothetical protein
MSEENVELVRELTDAGTGPTWMLSWPSLAAGVVGALPLP